MPLKAQKLDAAYLSGTNLILGMLFFEFSARPSRDRDGSRNFIDKR